MHLCTVVSVRTICLSVRLSVCVRLCVRVHACACVVCTVSVHLRIFVRSRLDYSAPPKSQTTNCQSEASAWQARTVSMDGLLVAHGYGAATVCGSMWWRGCVHSMLRLFKLINQRWEHRCVSSIIVNVCSRSQLIEKIAIFKASL